MNDTVTDRIIENLKEVYDPEISVNIYDLGLIYDIDVSQFPKVTITHTLTSAFCPSSDEIVWGIREACMSAEGVTECEVITTFTPEFTQDMMSDEAKLAMGIW
jgi:metal-sulfur cluster biosynthetic enzyme